MLRAVTAVFIAFLSFNLWSQDTELKLYQPFDDHAQQSPRIISQQVQGECWQQSQRIKREDAWRCMAQGKIYDPCFVKQYGAANEAICPQSPWVGTTVKITLSSPVDNSQNVPLDMAEAYPWAIELTDGEKCQAVDEGGNYDGLPIRYQCDRQSVLIGHIQRCKAEWGILQKTASGVSTAIVARAWF
ncbi:hypothetical protein [Legionella jordanis]|uniref:Uncharacterized protein n=1 Tax=Legionella jordanis TaxID=456 RepID=A0A0W0VG15_9GAMM|nr:hypothetical protein [Legionella jordanis]KTD19026.1 hypothetical protein Ljor_0249 [Legionella jordanis]RMX05415.1 hypothetical protein EAW55_01825 [Legionella jordanis]RMX19255.1 hypothetical protein EAS68_06575 [Legionella jordanis]VEH13128.1 Uncharacterised protein [Legionella jordanis]HAT8714788.1 hypothetical protein [Legionella jordanis]